MKVRAAFLAQGEACAALGSPFMQRLMQLVARRLEPGQRVADKVLDWQGDPSPNVDSLPLRLAGALHALRVQGKALTEVYPPNVVDDDTLWRAVCDALSEHAEHMLEWLDSPPQTNEVRRSAVILGGLARIRAHYDQPVELLELGASAGLNLCADLYRLELSGLTLGRDTSDVVLAPDWSGSLPTSALPKVVARRGVDLAPIDPGLPDGQLRLLAYLWPDQPERMARTRAAIAEAARTGVDVQAGDAADWLAGALAHARPDRLMVVFHTVAWQYFPQATRARLQQTMATARVPLVQLAMEADGGEGALVSLTHWPDGRTEKLGRADFHGRWIRWN
ncbi:MAG: DUF2332 family protein [Silicimonas sp.]|nr:DUF2332 family protein [Silicimonas sp.]